jgi:scyllo-inositol 2-dehydrogenase (NADP+)
VRGEEYSAQLDAFVARVQNGPDDDDHGFASAATTDDVIAAIVTDAARPPTPVGGRLPDASAPLGRRRGRLRRLFGRRQ